MMNKIIFLGEMADYQFKKWQLENSDSLYLNIRGKKAMQHKANCWHLGDGEGLNSASNSKVCASDSDELKQWSEDNNLEFEICFDCNRK